MCNSSAPALAKTIQYLSLIRDITCLLNIFLIFVIFIFFLTTFVELIIYNILFQIKNNTEVEQIFIDYIVYNEDRDDPVLKLANSYWK